ncbi:MAG: dihydroorotase family protein [Candidatus Diapherotrites archaeon]|nr:dihydroorotase family protein [Candidatus Diapherotrites archaeon]
MSLAIRNGKVFTRGRLVSTDVLCDKGRIKKIGKNLKGDKAIDASGRLVLPGVIDPHVHFRTPGEEYKEDWKTGSRAAAKGGVTTVLDMPNNKPSITTQKLLDKKRKAIAGKSLVNYGLHFGATADNMEEISDATGIASVKAHMGSSTGDLLVPDTGDLYKVFHAAKIGGHVVAVHAENNELINKFTRDAKRACEGDPIVHTRIRRNIVAGEAASLAAIISKEVGNRLHICHISTRQELDVVRMAGGRITCEATTHHLVLEDNDMRRLGNYAKMNPPLRSHEDRMALWANRKLISCWCTDHAPHTREEKERDYWHAPAGVPGVETLLPLHLDAVNKGMETLPEMVARMTTNPARIFRLEGRGELREGFAADISIVDMDAKQTITNEDVVSKCGWTPYDGLQLQGVPTHTIVNGEVVFDGEFGAAVGVEAYTY